MSPGSYLAPYTDGMPASYAGVRAFAAATGVRPGLVAYYSAWNEQFRVSVRADQAARHHALPIVQIDPEGISLAAIAHGRYDAYLRSYARSVRATGQRRWCCRFGHEMNSTWYSTWGYHHVPPAGLRGGLAAYGHGVPVREDMRQRDLAVDGQRHQKTVGAMRVPAVAGGGRAART